MSDKATTIESREHNPDLVVFVSDTSKTAIPSQNYQKEYPGTEVKRAEYPLNVLELRALAKEAEIRSVAVVAIATAKLTEQHIQEIQAHLERISIPLITLQLKEERGTPGEIQGRLFNSIRDTLAGSK
jgi:hypothetical protein